MFLLLAILGFDELLYVLTRPFLLVGILFLVFVFARSYIQQYLNEFLQSGPASITVPLRMVLQKLPVPILDAGNAEQQQPEPIATKPKME